MIKSSGFGNPRLALGLFLLLLVCCTLAVPPFAVNETIEDALVDAQFKLRGERRVSEQFALVFIAAEDIRSLGGWPLTRDYYGYLMHVLAACGAKVIGFDLLLDAPQWRYPEFDSVLANYFSAFERDCLPLTFAELEPTRELFRGRLPAHPARQFQQRLGGEGFSNLERAAMARRAPLLATANDTLVPAFGLELARLFLEGRKKLALDSKRLTLTLPQDRARTFPLDARGRLRLNHFGGVEQVAAISLVDLLQTFSAQPESLDFHDKLVLVAVTDPSLSTFKSTPLSASVPASFIHLTVAENLIQQNYLRELALPWRLLLIAVLVLALWFMSKIEKQKLLVGMSLGLILSYWSLALFFFKQANVILPLFYPSLAAMSSMALVLLMRQRERRELAAAQRQLLQEQILAKEIQLEEAATAAQNLKQQRQQEAHEQEASAQARKQQAEEHQQKILLLEKQLRDLRAYAAPASRPAPSDFAEIVHAPESPMAQALALIAKVARDDIPVLIQGETGTGKELIARAIHQASRRNRGPFLAVNCGALPETLLESELFGHEKGSFTGAHARRRGRFELAEGGTLFLDEISETSPGFQARLLRVLQEGVFERVGGEQSLRANVRVLAASSRDLQKEVAAKNFRADLFYRLNGFMLALPRLRERAVDLPLLLRHFLRKHGHANLAGFSEEAMTALQSYEWPGNVRELENVARRAALLAQGAQRALIRLEDLPEEILAPQSETAGAQVYQALPEQILQSLRALKFSRAAMSQTAKALGNRDRGTITEYFRGMCFESFVRENYDATQAASRLAGTDEAEIVQRVRAKLEEYLENLRAASSLSAQCKGLPKRYHEHVERIAERWGQK